MEIIERDLTFIFPENIEASKYDEWLFYRDKFLRQFSGIGGVKAVDIIVIENEIAWLIEIKDFRRGCNENASSLAKTIALKVRDTLACIATAKNNAEGVEKNIAQQVLSKDRIRIVFHMEQNHTGHRLRPFPIDPSHVQQKLKQYLSCIDSNPLVANIDSLPDMDIPWGVRNTHDS